MKTSLSLFVLLFVCSTIAFAQKTNHNQDGSGKVVLDNDKLEVVEYVGQPQGNVCGIGEHHHDAHLTVALNDAEVLLTSLEGEQQTVEIPSGAAIWFEAGTHSVKNEGNKETKFLLVYLKE